MRNDGWLGRNHLKGMIGNRADVLLAACGRILPKLLRWIVPHPALVSYCLVPPPLHIPTAHDFLAEA